MRTGQYDRYDKSLGGLYLAVPHGLVKKAEVPDHLGILVVAQTGENNRAYKKRDDDWYQQVNKCSCVRHPKPRESSLTPEQCWWLVWKFAEMAKEASRQSDVRSEEYENRIGEQVGQAVANAIRQIRIKNTDKRT